MVSRFAVAVIAASLFVMAPVSASAASCTAAQIATGTCSVGGGTTGGGVDLWGDVTTGGSGGSAGDGGDGLDECPIVVNDQCQGSSPPKGATGPTTVHDLESFRPQKPEQFVEPAGWSVRRVPTNFWSTSGSNVVSGELLGNPADVRFTPVMFRRTFGDGDRQNSPHRGATWSALGQRPWTRTATSHPYADVGTYRIRLTVWFSAEFRFGEQDWRPLDGLVAARANDLTLVVLSADTVLVDRPCGVDVVGCPTS